MAWGFFVYVLMEATLRPGQGVARSHPIPVPQHVDHKAPQRLHKYGRETTNQQSLNPGSPEYFPRLPRLRSVLVSNNFATDVSVLSKGSCFTVPYPGFLI